MVNDDLRDAPRVVTGDALPPYDEMLEQVVIGCLLSGCDSSPAAKSLSVDSFYLNQHRDIIEAIEVLRGESKPCDTVSVALELKRAGKGEPQSAVFGYVMGLPDKVPAAGLFEYWVPQLLELQQRRNAKKAIVKLGEICDGNFEGAAAEIESLRKAIQPPTQEGCEYPLQPILLAALARWEHAAENAGKLGVMTGFTEFDRRTGGLKPGTMTVVAAETNGGKTSFALNVANYAATNGNGVLLQSLEMSREELADILMALNAKVSRNSFNTGRFTEREHPAIVATFSRLQKLPLFIRDAASPKVREIESEAEALGGKIKLVVVDYIQIVESDDTKSNREQQVAQTARGLRAMAKRLNVALLVLSQLNDDGKLRESRVVAHEAHNVILLETTGAGMKAKVVKGRSIPRFEFELDFEPQHCLLKNRNEAPTYDND